VSVALHVLLISTTRDGKARQRRRGNAKLCDVLAAGPAESLQITHRFNFAVPNLLTVSGIQCLGPPSPRQRRNVRGS
jgi:hypothetical protein